METQFLNSLMQLRLKPTTPVIVTKKAMYLNQWNDSLKIKCPAKRAQKSITKKDKFIEIALLTRINVGIKA